MPISDANTCPDCHEMTNAQLDRRKFVGVVGGAAVLPCAIPTGALSDEPSAAPGRRNSRPAEALIRELYAGMNSWQREHLVYPWNHGAENNRTPTRLRMYNSSLGEPIGDSYTRAQRELVERILKAISSGEEGYARISRNGRWDTRNGILDCGAHIFGDPTNDRRFSFVFSGHHMTIRCDGNSEPNVAFGGPIFYGHSPNGYSRRNVFHYQTVAVKNVYEALTGQQRRGATVTGTPGEWARSVEFRAQGQAVPGIPGSDLNRNQRRLVQTVMQTLLSPYRREDVNEVMQIVRRNGGIDNINLAFYRNRNANDREPWHFWRLEGRGFVWNFRILPHVHTYVNIAQVTPKQHQQGDS